MMRRCTLVLIAVTSPVWAQASREDYRALYVAWRQAAPSLEQDAATPSETFAAQLQKSAEAAQTFMSARAAYLASIPADAAEQSKWAGQSFARAEVQLNTPAEVQQLLAVTAARVATIIGSYSTDDKDPAIRRVRQALDRERVALKALTETLNAKKASVEELIDITDNAAVQRGAVIQAQTASMARRMQLAEHIRLEATDWAQYYKELAEGSASGGRVLSSVVAPGPAASPSKITRPPATVGGQLALSRYTGEWMFPAKGLFFGPQPEIVELAVQESNGQITGTLTARFARIAGNTQGPALALAFQGPMQPSIAQTFPARTTDGVNGTIELIPGSAFNLLEVNVQTEPAQNRPGSANFMLVKR